EEALAALDTDGSVRGDEVDFPWDELDERPTIYASFGSQIYYQPDIFERIARATEPLDVEVVVSCGDLAETAWAEGLPDHVIPVEYAPQRELLERVRLMITHGGANSVMEALTAGVPVLISPVCNDQPMQAYFVDRCGVGRELDLYEADDTEASAAIRHLLDPTSARRSGRSRLHTGRRMVPGGRQS
ncbi:MAG: glycosyltransferase, partial [Bradymonadaceae bacterium]